MRQRSADDVEHIYAILQQRKREREEALRGEEPAQPPCDTEQDTQDFACGWRKPTYEWVVTAEVLDAPLLVEPGEFTDGA
jgi:hypothetical protein